MTRRPRVATVVTANRLWGGSYQYSRQLVRSLTRLEASFDVVLVGALQDEESVRSTAKGTDRLPGGLSAFTTLTGRLWSALPAGWRTGVTRLRFRLPPLCFFALRTSFRRWARNNGIDLLVLCEPNTLGFEARLPYVMPIHDLLHRLYPEFPETRGNGAWESREYCYRHAARSARCIFVDSETSKEDVVRLYGANRDRVRVLPFFPSISTDPVPAENIRAIRKKYALPARYFFYPAQFWKHKNHVRLVRALRLLSDSVPDVRLILCGSPNNGFREYEREVAKLRMGDRVRNLGYVADSDLRPLYAGAVALVMPTFNGPINIPIVEAFALGVPVVTSDIRGVREHVADAAMKVDPRNEASLAETMGRVWTDETLRRELAARGRTRIGLHTEQDFTRGALEAVESALDDVLRRRRPARHLRPGDCFQSSH